MKRRSVDSGRSEAVVGAPSVTASSVLSGPMTVGVASTMGVVGGGSTTVILHPRLRWVAHCMETWMHTVGVW